MQNKYGRLSMLLLMIIIAIYFMQPGQVRAQVDLPEQNEVITQGTITTQNILGRIALKAPANSVQLFKFNNGKPWMPPQYNERAMYNLNGRIVIFRWDAVPGASKYQIQIRRAKDNLIYRNRLLGDITRLSSARLNIAPSDNQWRTRYKWRVRAGNANGWGPWSGYWFFTIEHTFSTLQ